MMDATPFYIVQSPIYSFIITVLMVISVLNHYYFRETIHFRFIDFLIVRILFFIG